MCFGTGRMGSFGAVGDETPLGLGDGRGAGNGGVCAAATGTLGDEYGESERRQTASWVVVFRTSERCVACHNGLKTKEGEDISIGLDWSASIMANASRDPYWQSSVRRESIDHPESSQAIQDDCSICHMPAVRMAERTENRHTDVFGRFPLHKFPTGDKAAADGVTLLRCATRLRIKGWGTPATFVGEREDCRCGREWRTAGVWAVCSG